MTSEARAWAIELMEAFCYVSTLMIVGYVALASRTLRALVRRIIRAVFAGPVSILDVLGKDR